MPNFDPAYALMRVAYQTAQGLVPLTGWKDTLINAEGFASTPGVVERTAISPVQLAALRGKTATAPTFGWDAINPDDPCGLLLFPSLGFVSTTSPTAGVYYHDLDASAGDDPTPGWSAVRLWRDGEVGHTFIDYLINQATISFGEDALVGATFQGAAAYGHYWGDAAHTAGAGTASMRLRGVWGEEFDGTTIVVEVVDDSPLVVKVKRGGGAYSANQTITTATWSRINGDGDLLLGDLASPVELYVAGAVAIGDIYTFSALTSPWVPSLADPDNVVSEVYSSVLVDGDPFVLKSGTLTQDKPAEAVKGFGGVRPFSTRRRGTGKPTLAFSREAIDEFVRRRLETGAVFDFDLKLYSASKIAATDYNYGLEISLTGIRMTGSTPVVTGGTAPQQDQITTTGGTLTARIINSTASML